MSRVTWRDVATDYRQQLTTYQDAAREAEHARAATERDLDATRAGWSKSDQAWQARVDAVNANLLAETELRQTAENRVEFLKVKQAGQTSVIHELRNELRVEKNMRHESQDVEGQMQAVRDAALKDASDLRQRILDYVNGLDRLDALAPLDPHDVADALRAMLQAAPEGIVTTLSADRSTISTTPGWVKCGVCHMRTGHKMDCPNR